MSKPLCFVSVFFGEKKVLSASGIKIDFDSIYDDLVCPAVERCGFEPIRADKQRGGGMSYKAMLERLILCDLAVVDITAAAAAEFYYLGVRHGIRPYKTALIYAGTTGFPLDSDLLPAMPYSLDPHGKLADKNKHIQVLMGKLNRLMRESYTDSTLFQLVDELMPQTLAHQKTDIFRDRVAYSPRIKERLKGARQQGKDAVKKLELELGDIENIETGILVDLLLSYRAAKAWEEMIALVDKMPKPLAQRTVIQEQLGFALNRAGQKEKAEAVIRRVIDERAPSSENYALLGRIYKDRREQAREQGDEMAARQYLEKAIDIYIKGFETDWRDAYPGINAVNLLELHDPDDPRKKELLPVVAYAVNRKVAQGSPDYWDYATLLELAVLAEDPGLANTYLNQALLAVREPWEPETTARTLALIRENREKRHKDTSWLKEIEDLLLKKTS